MKNINIKYYRIIHTNYFIVFSMSEILFLIFNDIINNNRSKIEKNSE